MAFDEAQFERIRRANDECIQPSRAIQLLCEMVDALRSDRDAQIAELRQSSQEDTAHHAELGISPGGIGVGATSLPPASPPDGVEELETLARTLYDAQSAVFARDDPMHKADSWDEIKRLAEEQSWQKKSLDFIYESAAAILAAGYRKPSPASGDAMEVATCPNCGSGNVVESLRNDPVHFGVAPETVVIPNKSPVGHCNACDFEWTDFRGEAAREAAVAEHLKATSAKEWLTELCLAIGNSAPLSDVHVQSLTGLLTSDRAATERRLQKLSDAVSSYITNIASVYPGVSREDGERQNYERLQAALVVHGLPQKAVQVIHPKSAG